MLTLYIDINQKLPSYTDINMISLRDPDDLGKFRLSGCNKQTLVYCDLPRALMSQMFKTTFLNRVEHQSGWLEDLNRMTIEILCSKYNEFGSYRSTLQAGVDLLAC